MSANDDLWLHDHLSILKNNAMGERMAASRIDGARGDGSVSVEERRAEIKVCGIGGAGGNAINRMIEEGMTGVQFIAINTDAQDLTKSKAPVRLQIGEGLGAGAVSEVGRNACEQTRDRIREMFNGADMVFLALGLGGGTGTGAAPIVAEEAAKTGALTVAVATLPFSFEGKERMANALNGLEQLEKYVDTLIVVPNDRIVDLSPRNARVLDALRYGDDVLHDGVRAITEIIHVIGDFNLDFADVRTIMKERGRGLMGIGIAEGENRALRAAQEAVSCPQLDQSNINGARGVIANVRAGMDMQIHELRQAVEFIKDNASPDAIIILGVVIDREERPEFQVTVIATGFPEKDISEYKNGPAEHGAPVPQESAKAPEPPRETPTQPVPKPLEQAYLEIEPPQQRPDTEAERERIVVPPSRTYNVNVPPLLRNRIKR